MILYPDQSDNADMRDIAYHRAKQKERSYTGNSHILNGRIYPYTLEGARQRLLDIRRDERFCQRFLRYTRHEGECLIWTGSARKSRNNRYAYGQMGVHGKMNETSFPISAHVVAFVIARGRFPKKGKSLFNQCGNCLCVRVDHWRELSQSRAMRGNPNTRGPLTPKQVREIRRLYGSYTVRGLADYLSLNRGVVHDVLRGKTYRWVK